MAKLSDFYQLCPLIDNSSLLGVSKDRESGNVTVTLGKNIAIKHKLLDQKQIQSWGTRDKFTSPVVYDPEEDRYIAVFNYFYVRFWTKEETQVDKLKKYKFPEQIQTIFVCEGVCFILFKGGTVLPLKSALKLRKQKKLHPIMHCTSEIIDVLHIGIQGHVYVGLLVNYEEKIQFLWTIFTPGSDHGLRMSKIEVERDKLLLSGYSLHKNENNVYFLTLWNDGKMLSNQLKPSETPQGISTEVLAVIETISTKQPVSMSSLNENYIAMYGADCEEEGAFLIIYNLQFRVTQCRQPWKMYAKGAKIWCIDNNLYLPIGQSLAVIPFQLDREQIKALVGSLKAVEIDPDISIVDQLVVAKWTENVSHRHGMESSKKKNITKEFRNKVLDFRNQGLPECLIIEYLLPGVVKNQDVKMISYFLNNFFDIPENCLVEYLKIVLSPKLKLFNGDYDERMDDVKPLNRNELLDVILSKPIQHNHILPLLRSIIDLDDVLKLIEYISLVLSENGHNLPGMSSIETLDRLISWCNVLFDANYQKLILTKDEKVKNYISVLHGVIAREKSTEEDLKRITVLLSEVCRGKDIMKVKNITNSSYSVELVKFF